MNRMAACLCLALVACTSTRTPSGYCEDDCREVWTAECFSQCGIERPDGCDGGVCRFAGTSGAGTGGAGSGGRGGGGSGGRGGGGGSGAGGTGGVVSGSGGTDGGGVEADARVACRVSSECEPEAPLCNAQGECKPCVNVSPCEGRTDTPHCDTRGDSLTQGQCVPCTADEHCADDLVCVDASCVACRDGETCPDDKPECSALHECAACTSAAACAGRGAAKQCDLDENSETYGQCVECLDHGDCDNPEPECGADRTCVPCMSDDACAGHDDTPYCNMLAGAGTRGQCVACTSATEVTACGAKACKRDTGTCTSKDRGTVLSCGACEADSECADDMSCVENRVSGMLEGTFCFWVEGTAGCADSVGDARRPYSEARELTSVDGTVPRDYCLPVTTCAALLDATGASGGASCSEDSDCGDPSFGTDGDCNAQDRCTYACNADYQCPQSGFTTCSGAPGFCELP